jgi:hypothetical protein
MELMLLSGVIMLSSGMITPPFLIFPENFTHSKISANPLFEISKAVLEFYNNLLWLGTK